MFGGKLIRKSRKVVEGSYKMYSYTNSWKETIDIDYAGELTPAVHDAIIAAFKDSNLCVRGGSSWGALRWPLADRVVGIDVEKRQLIIEASEGMAD